MATSVTYSVDGADESAAQAIKANAKLTVDELSANSIRFTCKGTSKSARLYVNYLKVAYETPGGTKVVTSIAITGTPAKTEYYTGDINGDGVVNTSDVTALVNAVLGDGDVTLETGDLNDDGLLDVTDATMLIYLLGEEN